MRRLTGLVVFAFVLWGGYWMVASTLVKNAVVQAVDQEPRLTTNDIRVAGFPNRFDTTFTEPSWNEAHLGWSAPFFQSFALSYKPTHLVFVWPKTQTVSLQGSDIEIAQDDLRGSVIFDGLTSLRLDRTSIVGDSLTITAPTGDMTRINAFRAATRQNDETGKNHQAAIELDGIDLPQTVIDAVFGASAPAAVVGQARVNTVLGFDVALERASLESGIRPQLNKIDVASADIVWGPLALAANGSLDVDGQGRLTGRIALTFQSWKNWFDALETLGLIPSETAQTWRRAAELLAATSGSSDTLTAPLSFQNGFMSLGPLPLGPAPRLR